MHLVTGGKSYLHQLFQIHPYLQQENFSQIFPGFDTDLSQDSFKAQFFWARGLRNRSFRSRVIELTDLGSQPVRDGICVDPPLCRVDHRRESMG